MEVFELQGQRGIAPLSPRVLDWNRVGDEFTRQCQKSYRQQITDFEDRLSEYLNCGDSLALNSGTSALHLALQVVGVKPGDTVLSSDFTFVASANPIRYLSADPVFIDSELLTWNMDPLLLETAIKELTEKKRKPKAIVLVHIYGNPAQIGPIMEIAWHYNIPVIEDAAQAFGSVYCRQKVGTFGTLGVYSFNNNKIFSTLGGGALVSKNKRLIDKARFFASQAKEPRDYYYHREIGYNYIISPVNASLGYANLPFVEEDIKKQRQLYENLASQLNLGNNVKFQAEKPGSYSNRWVVAVGFESESTRKRVQLALDRFGYTYRRLWKPLQTQPVFRKSLSYGNGVSDQLFKQGLCLPNDEQINNIGLSRLMGINHNKTFTT